VQGMKATESGLLVPAHVQAQQDDPTKALLKQQEGLSRLEKHFPQILTLAFALGARLTNYVNTHRISPKDLKFEKVLWHNDGTISFKVTNKGKPLSPMDVHLT